MNVRSRYIVPVILTFALLVFSKGPAFGQSCDPSTPTFTFDLTGNPDSVWISPSVVRSGLCCGLDPADKPPIRCVEFFFTLDDEAEGIRFDIASGAIPPGALGYQINCGPVTPVGEMICLSGPGPHRLTFCKPGNNPNTYSITSVARPQVSEPTVVSDACTGILTATDYDISTIQWTSVPNDPVHNSYLSCTSACSTTVVTYQPGAPPYIDYQVSGYPIGGCAPTPIVNITRVYFVNDKYATIQPQDPVICFGGTNATITANGNGGAPPYRYRWSTGDTTQSISVGIGTYWVEVSDSTSCPTAYDTVTVTAFLSPITANAGPDVTSCVNNPSVSINGSVFQAAGGIWSGGSGAYAPSDTSLSVIYTPSAGEVSAGTVTHILTTTGNRGCPPSRDTVVQTIVPSPVVNAGPDKLVCANNPPVILNGSVQNAGGGTWSGGTGTFLPDANSPNVTYYPTATEISTGTITLTLTSTGNGTCNPVSDQVLITIIPAPVVDAGTDLSICANNAVANLSGTVTGATGGTWTGGNGIFSPNANTLNAAYRPSASEISSGTVTLTLTSTGNGLCQPVTDQVVISITPAPTVNAGTDQTVCANNASVSLTGTVTVAAGGNWTGGNGTFNPSANSLNTIYTPTATEITNGLVTLTLTSTGNGNCLPVTDKMEISITPAPVVNAGPDRSVCANNASLSLNGSVTIASGGSWSGGGGIFSPDANSLNTTYTPSAAEISGGSVTLTLSSTGNGNCLAVSDQMTVTITPAPTADAGPDQSICANNAAANLSGIVTVASGGIWSGGNGTFSPNAVTLMNTYSPTASEISSGSVTLTLTTTGNGNCLPVSDQMLLTITPAPTINAGSDQSICANNAAASLNGSVTTATGGTWSGGSGTYVPDANTLATSYTPSPSEISAGTVTLILTSTGNGNCLPVSDRMVLTITPAPTINAGPDQSVCSDVPNVQLNGTVTISTGGLWTTSGSGTFSGSSNLSTTYTPSATDISDGNVTLTLTSTGNGNCLPVDDNLVLTFEDLPTASAGPDQTVCTNNYPVQLNASGNAGSWSGGTGTFNPGANTMNPTYTPSAAETTAQTVTLTFTTFSNGVCPPVSDDVTITLPPGPIANAGGNRTVCADIGTVPLTGLVTNATGGTWSTSGTGSFSPDATSLNAGYVLSAADTTAGSVLLTLTTTGNIACNPPATDQVLLTITPAPVVNAGPDLTICADTSGITLNAFVTVATGVTWSTSGSGSFSPSEDILDPVYIPSAADTAAGSVTLTVTTTGNGTCNPVSDDMVLTITPVPLVNAGLDQTVCSDALSATLTGSVYNASGGVWSTSGSGVFSPNEYSLNAEYFPSTADRSSGTVNIFLTSTGNGNCRAVSESSLILSITPAPTANAGPNQTVCGDTSYVSLNGTIAIATRAKWASSGTGSFSPNDSTLNASYIPSSSDTLNGSVTLTLTTTGNENCINVSDQINISITPAPTVYAGPDQTVCGNNSLTNLNGSATIATGGIWSGGSGTFSPGPSDLDAAYQPSSSEINSGTATLILTSTGNGMCKAVSDTLTIDITESPTINAGPDQTLCKSVSDIILTGNVAVSGGGAWSSLGSGIFSDQSSLSTSYYPTSTDKADSTVTLVLTSTDNGNCLPVSDSVNLYFTDVPTADAGASSICADDPGIPLTGSITIAPFGTWSSSGTGNFSPSVNDLNAIYTPTNDDRIAGSVKLFLIATTCKSVADSIIVYLIPPPVSDAGPDQTVCANNSVTAISGIISNAGGGIWSTTGSGQFTPSATDLNVNYSPSVSDIINGFASLILTTTGNGNCRSDSDTLRVNITPAPVVNAGSDQTVCADTAGITLNGSVTVASGGTWTTSGSGSFTASTSMNTAYIPSEADITSGTITITLSSTGNGDCLPVTDNAVIGITPAPDINAGPDITSCEDVSSVAFYGTVHVATGGSWTTNGTGSFNNPNNLHTIYTMTNDDRSSGSISLYLTSTGNGSCKAVRDTVRLFITSLPSANAGTDQTVCNNNTGFSLSGSVSGVSGGIWSSSGSGDFTPAATSLSATYIPSPSDTTQGIVKLTLTTDVIGGCAVFDTMNVYFIDPLLNLPDHYCFENNLLIDSDPFDTISGGSFEWYRNDTLISGQANSSIVLNSRGIYQVVYTFDQCTVTDSTDVTYPVELTTTDKLVCEGGSSTLTTTIVPKAAYEWKHNGSVTGTNSHTINVTDDGNPVYAVMVTDSLGCIARDTALLAAVPPPVMTLTNIPSCIGDSVMLNASPSNNTDPVSSKYTWYRNGSLLPDTSASVWIKSTAMYSVQYSLGECLGFDSSVVTFYPLPVPNHSRLVVFCKETEHSTLLDAGDAEKYLWLSSGDTTRTTSVSNEGVYFVQITNPHNCSVTDSVTVRDICPPRLQVPTIFSPNGDGKNETFIVQSAYVKNFNLTIFNRWGEVIFQSEDISQSWDGTYRGEPMPVGVYPWIVTYEGVFKEYEGPYQDQGSVTLTR